MKDYFNLRKSELLLFALLAMLVGGVSPAWAETLTETFDEVTVTSRYLLSNGWVMIHSNDNYQGFGGSYDYQIKSGNYDGETGNSLSCDYSDNNEYVVIPTKLTGTFNYYVKRSSSSNGTVTFFEATKDGDSFTVTTTQLATTSTSSSWASKSFDLGDAGKYVAIRLLKSRIDQITATIYEEVSGPAFAVKDGDTKLTSPFTYSFGLATAGTTKEFTLSNPGNADLGVSVSETGNFGATLSASTIAAGGEVTLTLTMPEASGSSEVTITPDATSGIDPFVINVSGTIRDANKIYEALSSKPEGWTTTGTWNFNSTNGATTTAWYLSNNARLCTPLLTVSNDEVFIFEAKGNYEGYHALQLEYSVDGTNWTASQTSITMTSEWQTVTISDIPAGEYYIALHTAYSSIRNFYGGVKVPGANFAINTDGSSQNFGSVRFNSTGAKKEYNITNSGDKSLFVTITNPTDFTAEMTANAEDNNVYFTDALGWGAPNIHYWPNGTSWPGVPMTELYTNEHNQKVYYYELPANVEGVVFNGNGNQTVNIDAPNGKAYYTIDEKDGNNYKVGTWTFNNCVPAGKSSVLTVSMNTTSSGDKSGDVVLTFDALNKTSFTIPCTGNVKDENYLYVDFADGFPAGWQVASDWKVSTDDGYAYQESTTASSAFITTPLTVAANETLTFKAAKNASGNKSLKTRYSTNGGTTWSSYTSYDIETSGLTTQTVSGIPAGTVILEFLGNNVKIDDIEGFTKTTAPALALTESGAAVVNGSTKDLGNLQNENGIATYTLTNIGNANLVATLSGTDVTVSPASVDLAAGESKEVTVTMTYEEPYGTKSGSMTISSESWVGDMTVNFTAELVDPTDFVQNFESGKPAGWYSEAWTFDNGVAYVNNGVEKPMITEQLGAVEGKNVLSFDAFSTYENQTLNVYTSTDRKEWTLSKACALTATSQNFKLDALAEGNYYFKFGGALATTVDNIKGLKKLTAPAHDLYYVGATLPTDDITPIDTYTAKVKVASLRADETVAVELYFGETKVAEQTEQVVANGTTVEFTLTGKAPATGTFEVYAKVYNNDVNVETEKVNVTVAETTELAITTFAPVATAIQADEDNNFTAEFNVAVKNNGSTPIDVATIRINITDGEGTAYTNGTKTNETVFIVPGDYANDNAKLFIYRWSTDSDQEWDEFTKLSDNLWSADLNGKDKFIIVRKPSDATSGFDGAWNQSVDLTAADGICFTFQSWDNKDGDGHHYFTAGSEALLPNNATAKMKVAVTAPANDGGNFAFKAQESVTNSWWTNGYESTVTVKVTAATIVLDETVGTVVAGTNRTVQLKHTFVQGWNTVCLPFSIEAYKIHIQAKALAFTAYNTETKELTFSSPVTTLEAGKPYVIYIPTAITEPMEFTGVTIESTEAGKAEFNGVAFLGTYAPMAAGSLTDCYGFTAAGKIAKASTSTTMKGFRAYFTGVPANARVLLPGDDTQGISTISMDSVAPEGTYNLQGQKVEQLKNGGLYIINGKKVVIK